MLFVLIPLGSSRRWQSEFNFHLQKSRRQDEGVQGMFTRKQMRGSTSGQEALLGHFQVQCLWKALTSELVVCSFLLAP